MAFGMAFGMACMSPVVLAEFSVTNKTFDLDSDVLMHNPAALGKFEEHHV